MVMMVTSRARALRDPTQLDYQRAYPTLYINVTHVSNSEETSREHYAI